MEIKVGEWVTWTSQAGGSWKTKIGVITKTVKKNGEVVGCYVQVAPKQGSKAKPKMYYPRLSALKPYKAM